MVLSFERPTSKKSVALGNHLYSEELEQYIIGAILQKPEIIEHLELNTEYFSHFALQKVFGCAIAIFEAGKKPDMVSLLFKLKAEDDLHDWQSILASAYDSVPLASNLEEVKQWCLHLKELAHKRKLVDSAEKILYLAQTPLTSLEELNGLLPDKKFSENRTLFDEIKGFLIDEPSPAKKEEFYLKTSRKYKIPLSDIKKIGADALLEIIREEGKADAGSELDGILDATKSKLDLNQIIPCSLAQPINLLASTLNIRPECYLTALLSVTSSLFKTGTKVRLFNKTNFEVVPNLFGAIVAPPSQFKSPIINEIASKPLQSLQVKANKVYDDLMDEYIAEVNEYNQLSKEEKEQTQPPVKPPDRKRVLSYGRATSEAIRKQYQNYPEYGVLNLADELKSVFASFNQYRKGKGSDEEDLLELYDGKGERVLRVDAANCADLPDGRIFGVFGGIQPRVLQSLLKDCTDDNGKWARFNFVNQPLAYSELGEDTGSIDLSPMLASLYEKIDDLPANTYHLSKEAKEYFRNARNLAEKRKCEENRPGMQAVWGKVGGKLGKFAINLHIIWELMQGKTPSQEIPIDRMKAAVQLAKFYVSQVEALYVEFASGSELTPALAKIITLSERKGWIKARETAQAIGGNPKADQVRQWFVDLVSLGKGQTRGEGRRLEFNIISSTFSTFSTNAQKPELEPISNVDQFVNSGSTISFLLPEPHPAIPDEIDWGTIASSLPQIRETQFVENVDLGSTNLSTNKILTESESQPFVENVENVDRFSIDIEVEDEVDTLDIIAGALGDATEDVLGGYLEALADHTPAQQQYILSKLSPEAQKRIEDFSAIKIGDRVNIKGEPESHIYEVVAVDPEKAKLKSFNRPNHKPIIVSLDRLTRAKK